MTIKSEYLPGTFNWVDLIAKDANAVESFYCDLFGWTAKRQDTGGGPPYTMFFKGDHIVAGMGQMMDEMKAGGMPPTWNSYVSVADLAGVVEQLASLGGKVAMAPTKIFDAGSMAFVADPEGAPFALWQPDKHIGATLCNEPGSFCWNELAGRQDSTRDFYATLFGWTYAPLDGPMPYTVIKNQGHDNGGMIRMTAEWGDMRSHWMVYFAVEDTDASCKLLSELGGKVCVPPTDIPKGRFSVVEDPQGATFTLFKLNDGASKSA